MNKTDVEIMIDINAENERIAEEIKASLRAQKIYTINVMGAPGAGKTSSLIRIIQGLGDIKCAVIEGDIQSNIDTEKLAELGIQAVQINTGGACHIDATFVQKILGELELKQNSVLFIENIGNLVCPAEFNIGEEFKLLISTVTEGADKPYKYPLAFEKAGAIILNKADLLPHVDFDFEYFEKGVLTLNPDCRIFTVSAKTGDGFDAVREWIKAKL